MGRHVWFANLKVWANWIFKERTNVDQLVFPLFATNLFLRSIWMGGPIWFANLKMWFSNVDQIDFPRFANNLFLQSPGVSAAGPLKRTICINAYLPYTWITSVWLNQNWGLQTQVRAKKLTTLHNCFWKSKSASYDKASANTAFSFSQCYGILLFICCTSAEGPADGLVIRVDRSFLIIGARLPPRASPFKALKAFFCESTFYKALCFWYFLCMMVFLKKKGFEQVSKTSI